jgi:hypothetical protein
MEIVDAKLFTELGKIGFSWIFELNDTNLMGGFSGVFLKKCNFSSIYAEWAEKINKTLSHFNVGKLKLTDI